MPQSVMELLAFSQSSKRGIEATTTTVNSTAEINSAVNAASLISPLPVGEETKARQGPNRSFRFILVRSAAGINSRHAWLNRTLDRLPRWKSTCHKAGQIGQGS